ncbi:addiction module component [Phormidesmis priestleyi ULC007]|uniref:Addiction module component n=1 Tax=Phormidesmis priestleyi ULC007 TaxID=1920490 RepID=A0A2T1DK22_9CYAN|nr:addiction module component [Phormidesmis priestleyi]PSB20840.1 addiction module component [Phormidesmis priestleyi ULC007]PZO51795.1 MAG: addiction module component [Phormidesmis priestleyi]
MTLEQIEEEVLALPKDAQAALLARLLGYLGQTDMVDQEVAGVWVNEAERRDQAMDQSLEAGAPSTEVFQRIRASL